MNFRNFVAVASLVVLSASAPGASVRAAGIGAKRYVRGEAIVSLQPGTTIDQINAQYGNEVAGLLEEEGYTDIEIIKDIPGKDRIIQAKR